MSAVLTLFARELRSRWKGAVGLGLLLGIVLGGVLVSAAGARRTVTAYDRYLEYARAEDYSVGLPNPRDPIFQLFMGTVSEFPEVAEVAPIASLEVRARDGSEAFLSLGGIDDRFGSAVNRPKLTAGRMPDPEDPDEILVNQQMLDLQGLEVGGTFEAVTISTDRAGPVGDRGGESENRHDRVFTVTGVGVFPNEVVATAPLDDLPRVYLTPAYVNAHPDETEEFGFLAIRLEPGPSSRAEFREHLEAFLAREGVPSSAVPLLDGSSRQATVNRSIEPQAQALSGFALLLGLTAVLVIGQAIVRHLSADRATDRTAWALGYTRAQLVTVAALRALVIATLGAAVGLVVAIAGSVLMPLGPAAVAEPDPGVTVDAVVLLTGVLTTLVVFTAWAALSTRRGLAAPARVGAGRGQVRAGRPLMADLVASAGGPPTAVAGVQMAFQPGGGSALPTASAMVGTTIALAALLAAVTFSVNLDRLVDTPRLYGWAWDVQVGGGFDGIPTQPALEALRGNDQIESFSGGNSTQMAFVPAGSTDAVQVPVLGLDPIQGMVYPPLVEGRAAAQAGEVVLGSSTMEELGVRVGEQVTGELPGREAPTPLRVVGRAVFPAIGAGNFATTGLGRGAILPAALLDDPQEPGRYTYFLVEYVAGVDRAAVDRELQQDIEALVPDDCADLSCVASARRPGDIRTYDSIRATPLALAAMLALLGGAVLAHTLVTGVRRHRRDLGVLASIGFVRRQVGATTAWQAATVAVVSLVISIPLGLALGRALWTAFAVHLGVVTSVDLPMTAVVLAVPGTVLVAVAIALVPAVQAARARPVASLRSE